jgi:hypothetical protein
MGMRKTQKYQTGEKSSWLRAATVTFGIENRSVNHSTALFSGTCVKLCMSTDRIKTEEV